MKNKKISRILGVGLTLALLTSLFAVAAPASAADLKWSAIALPDNTSGAGWDLVPAAQDITAVAVAPDGSTIFAVSPTTIYRSTDGGASWTAASTPPAVGVTAIAVSPQFSVDSTVYAASTVGGAGTLYASTDGGASFSQVAAGIAGQVINDIALSPVYASDGLVLVGTSAAGAGAFGDVYQMGRPLTFGLNIIGAGVGEDITSVAFSPNYPSDRVILAVGSNATPATRLHTNVNWEAVWNTTIGGGVPTAINLAAEVGAVAGAIVSSDIALPSDYNGAVASGRLVYVTTNSALGTDDVYRINNITAGVALNPTAAADDAMSSLDFSGTISGGTLVAGATGAGQVYTTANPTVAAPVWVAAAANSVPSGGGPTQAALAADFATSNTVYAGTFGADSAFSVSTNGGVNFHQTALIDNGAAAGLTIQDLVPSPDYANDSTLFMVTGAAAGNALNSVWKSTDGGTSWKRVLNAAIPGVSVNGTGVVRPSPNYATDMTVYYAATGAGATAIRKSSDGGTTWANYTAGIANIGDLLVIDANTIFAGDAVAGTVQKSSFSGWVWDAAKAGGAGAINMLALGPGGEILVGGTGGVSLSTNGGTSYTAQAAASAPGGPLVVAFDADYANNGVIYSGSTTGATAGLWRSTAGGAWAEITAGSLGAAVPAVVGIVSAPDGALYAADPTAAAAAAGGVVRSLNPTDAVAAAGVPPAPPFYASPLFEYVSTGDGLTAGYTLASLALASGSNVLLASETSTAGDNRVRTYTDTLSTATPTTTATSTAASITFSWTLPTGATTVRYQLGTRTDYLTGYATAVQPTTVLTSITAGGLAAGTTYYWQTRVVTPVFGPWTTQGTIITTLPAPGAYAAGMLPAMGATGVSITPTFSWGAVAGAATYEFVLAEVTDIFNPDDPFAIADFINSGTTTTNMKTTQAPLKYNTTYWWRVRAVGAAVNSGWAVSSFTTMAEPQPEQIEDITPPAPPIEVVIPPAPPAPEITLEIPPSPAPVQVIPDYLLWVVVAVGGVLVIAVIVLIVRTRRVS